MKSEKVRPLWAFQGVLTEYRIGDLTIRWLSPTDGESVTTKVMLCERGGHLLTEPAFPWKDLASRNVPTSLLTRNDFPLAVTGDSGHRPMSILWLTMNPGSRAGFSIHRPFSRLRSRTGIGDYRPFQMKSL
jgi:hypothetical protein